MRALQSDGPLELGPVNITNLGDAICLGQQCIASLEVHMDDLHVEGKGKRALQLLLQVCDLCVWQDELLRRLRHVQLCGLHMHDQLVSS